MNAGDWVVIALAGGQGVAMLVYFATTHWVKGLYFLGVTILNVAWLLMAQRWQ